MTRPAPIPQDEERRLEALREYAVLDTAHEPVFDAITALAVAICDVPIATISLIDSNRQWFKSRIGLDDDETPREVAFCAHAMLDDALMEVPNALEDERFAANPLVLGNPNIRFYAGAPLRNADGHALGTVCVIDRTPRTLTDAQRNALHHLSAVVMRLLEARKDVAMVAKAQQARADAERRVRTIADNLPALVAFIDADERYRFVNATYALWLQRPLEEISQRTLAEVHDPALYDALAPALRRALSGRRESFELELTREGVVHFARGIFVPERDAYGVVTGVYALTHDATRLKYAEDELRRLAHFDPLTGLANRARLVERLGEAIARNARDGKSLGVLYLDLDRFKSINDTLGHQAGDAVLAEFARRLRARIRTTDTAARLGGDEFVVVLEGLAAPAEAERIAGDVVAMMLEPIALASGLLTVSTSIGVATRKDEKTPEALLEAADAALYRAKAKGRAGFSA